MDAAQMCLEPSPLNLGKLKMCELKHQQLLCRALKVWDALIRCHRQLTWLCTGSQASGPPSLTFISLPESHGPMEKGKGVSCPGDKDPRGISPSGRYFL